MNYCRLCAQEKPDLIYILDKENLVKNIARYLNILIFVEDPLSHKICISCVNETERVVEFITRCQRAQREAHFRGINLIQETPNHSPDILLDHIKNEYPHLVVVDEEPDILNSETILKYSFRNSEVSQASDGGPNTFILIVNNGDECWADLSTLGKHSLKQLGKNIYKRHYDRILKEHEIVLTVSEIKKELENLEDPLQEEVVEPVRNVDTEKKDTPPRVALERSPDFTLCSTEEIERKKSTNKGELLRCSECSFATLKNWYLNQHFNDTHAKPFSCDQCEKAFGNVTKLSAHKVAEHTNRSPLTCKLCNETFTQKYCYTKHLKTHTSNGLKLNLHKLNDQKTVELPCKQCSSCSYMAKSKYYLKQHEREVHRKLFECYECGKKLSKKSRLLKHIQSKHGGKTKYECKYCHSKYTSKKWFEVHVLNCPCALLSTEDPLQGA